MNKKRYYQLVLAIGLVALGVFGRLARVYFLPGENVEPLTAVALLAGALISAPYSLIVPLMTIAVSDAVIGMGHNWIILFTWSAWAIIGAFGWLLRRSNKARASFVPKFLGLGLAASLFFFLYTNFGVWLEGWLYPRTFAGLILCYVNAIPFWRNNLLGNLIILPVASLAVVTIYRLFAYRRSYQQRQLVTERAANEQKKVE